MFMFFFFSSRRRHTRCSRDWSSDVCSSDLSSAPSGETATPWGWPPTGMVRSTRLAVTPYSVTVPGARVPAYNNLPSRLKVSPINTTPNSVGRPNLATTVFDTGSMRYTVSTFVLTKIVWSSGATMTSNGSPITGITSTCVSRPTSTIPTLSLNWFATYAVLPSWVNATSVGTEPTVTPSENVVWGSLARPRLSASRRVTYTTPWRETAVPNGRCPKGWVAETTPPGCVVRAARSTIGCGSVRPGG